MSEKGRVFHTDIGLYEGEDEEPSDKEHALILDRSSWDEVYSWYPDVEWRPLGEDEVMNRDGRPKLPGIEE